MPDRETIYNNVPTGRYPGIGATLEITKNVVGKGRFKNSNEIKEWADATRGADGKMDYRKSDKLMESMRPGLKGYSDPVSQDRAFNKAFREEEMWRKFLGFEQIDNTIVRSKYRPTVESDPNSEYYTSTDSTFKEGLIEAIVDNNGYIPGRSLKLDHPSVKNTSDKKYPKQMMTVRGLANATVDQGRDERGDYFSVYDKWDFANPSFTKAGKPYEIYDRVYVNKQKLDSIAYQKDITDALSEYHKYKELSAAEHDATRDYNNKTSGSREGRDGYSRSAKEMKEKYQSLLRNYINENVIIK